MLTILLSLKVIRIYTVEWGCKFLLVSQYLVIVYILYIV